jgi:diguanylate cyclase (GGDEF)-like protein
MRSSPGSLRSPGLLLITLVFVAILAFSPPKTETAVALLLFILGSIVVILLLLYAYIKVRRVNARLNQQLHLKETALNSARANDQQLVKEVQTLQGKMSRLMEDPVTRLLGWQLFEDRLAQTIKESERYHLIMGILLIDIDDFKMINDALSYEVGDALLIEVAERLKSCIRQVDSIARFSKDTFVVLLTQLAKPETAAIVAQRMLHALSSAFVIQGHELYITAGIGIAIYPNDAEDGAELLRSGDHALHLAKGKGKNAYQFYQEKLHEQSQRDLTLYTNLGREASFAEFVLYYQPIISGKTNEVVCMNALLYWQQTEFGLIKPEEVFALAERQRKLNIITEWTLKHACQQFLHWRSLGFCPAYLGISVSIKQLENTPFIYRLSQIFQELEFNPACLLLEIKENTSDLSSESLEKGFNMLKYLGVKIAIDNFGTGAFSLVHLKNFSIDYLKLDPALIQDIENAQTIALIKSLIFMGKTLGIEIIIQGVESENEVRVLKALDCVLMQGSFYSVPISEAEVLNKMHSFMA